MKLILRVTFFFKYLFKFSLKNQLFITLLLIALVKILVNTIVTRKIGNFIYNVPFQFRGHFLILYKVFYILQNTEYT